MPQDSLHVGGGWDKVVGPYPLKPAVHCPLATQLNYALVTAHAE